MARNGEAAEGAEHLAIEAQLAPEAGWGRGCRPEHLDVRVREARVVGGHVSDGASGLGQGAGNRGGALAHELGAYPEVLAGDVVGHECAKALLGEAEPVWP